MDGVGEKFAACQIYIPEMLVSALTMKKALGIIKPLLKEDETESKGTILMGTVRGDLHDIGKNLVIMMLEGAGFKVIDLGVDLTVERAVERFGGIDVLVNNAGAISLTGTLETKMRRFDLMMGVNVRGTFAASRACLPHLLEAPNPHILNIAPPLNLHPRWFRDHCAYTISKYGMSLCVLGMAEEFREAGVAVNALWPATAIATAALRMLKGMVEERMCRTPEIMADAAHAILVRDSRSCTGNLYLDEEVLREEGVTDFSRYAVDPGSPLMPDLFVGEGDWPP